MMRSGLKMWILTGMTAIMWLSAPFGMAEEAEKKEMSASGLLTEAGRLLELQSYDGAIPLLEEYLERMKESKDKRVKSMMQDVRFKLGKINVHLGNLEDATKYLEGYLDGKPVYRRRDALKTLAVSYFELNKYDKSISAVTNAFAPPPEVEEEKEEKVDLDKMSKEELGGLSARKLRRLEKDAEEYAEEDELALALSADKPKEEAEYTLAERVLLNMTLAESYAGLEEWEPSVEPYQFVIDHAEHADRRGFAIMQLVKALVQLDEFEQVRTLVSDLSKTEARYDIRVNMAMMNAASALFNVAEYDSALSLYRMILPRQALADYHMGKANELRVTAGLPEMVITVATNEAGRIETLFGRKYAEAATTGEETVRDEDFEMPMELIQMEESIGGLMSLPPYEDDVIYRIAQLYLEVGRAWEALASFDLVSARVTEGDLGTRAFCDALQVLVSPLALYDRVETRALGFLEDHKEGLAPRQVAYHLTAAYQRQERMKDIKKLRPTLDGFVPSDDLVDLQYECELYYMQAIADLMLLNYKEAKVGFEEVLANYPGSHQEDNLRYWHAMTQLFLQDYDSAYDEFEYYLDKFPRGNWVSSTWFQCGICQFARERYDEAEVRFTHVIESYKKSTVYPDACSMRGDILGSKGLLDEAIRDYEEAIATAVKPNQATYAVFQMAAVFEAEKSYDDIIVLVNRYLDTYGEKADVAKAAYWIGKIKLEQGLTGEAIAAYLDTILKYGDDIRQDGVDLIIAELMKVSKRLEAEDVAGLKESLTAALNQAEGATLQLRLRVMLADMDKKKVELGEILIVELADLTKAPPPVLAVICDASFAKEDYSRAEEILTLFLNHFEDSDYMRAAYKLRGFDLFKKEDWDGVAKIVSDAQGLYGTDLDMAWAQMMKGRLELHRGELVASRKTFRDSLSVRAWRGPAYAEASYYLGEVEEKAGDPKKAFAWYQRTYFQYKGHAKGYWAAEAYLASARCLEKMGLMVDVRNTYRAMLYDRYVNTLPQASQAQEILGADEVIEIQMAIAAGVQTNVTVTIDAKETP